MSRNRTVKKATFALLTILMAAQAVFALDGTRITVTDYTRDSGIYVLHATGEGKPIDLLCNEDSPYCSVLKPGEYWMVDWTVPLITYEGPYTCEEVDLYAKTQNGEQGKKLGEYCAVKKDGQESGSSNTPGKKAPDAASGSKSTEPATKHR